MTNHIFYIITDSLSDISMVYNGFNLFVEKQFAAKALEAKKQGKKMPSSELMIYMNGTVRLGYDKLGYYELRLLRTVLSGPFESSL